MSISIYPENCEYIAEGNAGIVVRLIKEGTVLRLKKEDNSSMAGSSASEDLKELQSQNRIIENVFKPILGESFVNTPLIVCLSSEDIHILNASISRFRPAHRRHKTVNEKCTYVCMLPDYCSLPKSLNLVTTYGPVLCIEIKPKQGFTKDEYLPSKFFPQRLPMCRFCMMQNYKFMKGLVLSKSGYCPTDLFSGCYKRMLHALKMLFKTPQNNLRLFKNQKLIYSEEKRENLNKVLLDFIPSSIHSFTDLLCDLIIQALVKPFPFSTDKCPVFPQKEYLQNCTNAHTLDSENDSCHQLPFYCVLERILNCQLLDDLPIADLYQLYLQVKKCKNSYSDSIGCYSRSEIPPFVGELKRSPNESLYEYASRKVWEFLLALVMKDCSIMLTLKHLIPNSSNETHNSQNIISDKCGNFYAFSIALADLDAKPLKKVEKVHSDLSFILESFGV